MPRGCRAAVVAIMVAGLLGGCRASSPEIDPVRVLVVERDGARPVEVVDERRSANSLAWSPDGRTLAWLSSELTTGGPRDPAVELAAPGGSRRRRVALVRGGTPSFGPLSSALDWSPDGRVLAAVTARTLLLVRADGRVARRIGLGPHDSRALVDGATGVGWSPDGRRLAVVESRSRRRGARTVVSSSIELRRRGGGLVRRIRAPGQTPAIVWSSDGRRLAFTSAVSTPPALEPARPRDATPPPPGSPPPPRQAQQDLYVADAATGRVERVTATRESEAAPAWEPHGQGLLFARMAPGRAAVGLVPRPGARPRMLGELLVATAPSWSPSGDSVAFGAVARRGGRNELHVADPRGGRPRRIPGEIVPGTGEWSPDGRAIAVVRFGRAVTYARDRIEAVDPHTGTARTLTEVEGHDLGTLAWSPDGRRLAFTAQRARRPD